MASPTGSIAGKLWNDTNADGVQQSGETDTGVRTVQLLDGSKKILKEVKSGPDSHFLFPNIENGTYFLFRPDLPKGYRLSNGVACSNYVQVTVSGGLPAFANIASTDKPLPPPSPVQQPSTPPASSTANKPSTPVVTVPTIPVQPPATPAFKTKICAVDLNAKSGVAAVLASFKLQGNRVWPSPNGFAPRSTLPKDITNAIDFFSREGAVENALPTFCVTDQPTRLSSLAGASDYMFNQTKLAIQYCDRPGSKAKDMPIRWELLQEPDLVKGGGNPGYLENNDMKAWVTTIVAVGKVLQQFGDRVILISGGFSWDSDTLDRLAPQIADYVQGFGFHGYAPKFEPWALKRYDIFSGTCKKYNKFGSLTEFGMGRGADVRNNIIPRQQWIDEDAALLEYVIRLGIEEVFFYSSFNTNNSTNAAQSLADLGANGQPKMSDFGKAYLAKLQQLGMR